MSDVDPPNGVELDVTSFDMNDKVQLSVLCAVWVITGFELCFRSHLARGRPTLGQVCSCGCSSPSHRLIVRLPLPVSLSFESTPYPGQWPTRPLELSPLQPAARPVFRKRPLSAGCVEACTGWCKVRLVQVKGGAASCLRASKICKGPVPRTQHVTTEGMRSAARPRKETL